MFNTGDGSAPSINCPWAGLGKLHLARKAALAAMQTAAELAAIRQEGASVQQELAGAAVQAEYLAEAAVKTAEKTAEEVAVGVTLWFVNRMMGGPSSPWLLNFLQPGGYGLFFAACWGLLGGASSFRKSAAQDEPEPAAKFLARIAARGRIAACCQNDEDM